MSNDMFKLDTVTEVIRWHKVGRRELTAEEKSKYAEEDIQYTLVGIMPENGENVLIQTKQGVFADVCGVDFDNETGLFTFYLEVEGDWEYVIAWASLPRGI